MPALTLTIDLEDPSKAYRPDGRYALMVRHILDLCEETERKATFFTVGKLSRANPKLIQTIAGRGHEIAYHTAAHIPLTEDTPENFKAQTQADKAFIQDLTGRPLLGFRAPCYSLTPSTHWAVDSLKELGFLYSSSIMPSLISMQGFKKKPVHPFLWENGLIELPMPMAGIGQARLPFNGGIYLYLMPFLLTRLCLASLSKHEALWTYAHPYDFDRTEPYAPMPDTPAWISRLLYLSRFMTEHKIRKLLSITEVGEPLFKVAERYALKNP